MKSSESNQVSVKVPFVAGDGLSTVAATSASNRSLPRELQVFLKLNAFLSFFCLSVEGFFKYVRHIPGKYDIHNWPVLHFARWIDFRYFIARFQYLHQARFFSTDPALGAVPFMYPAPCALLYEAFYWFKPHPIRLFLFTMAAFVAIASIGFYRKIVAAGLGVSAAAMLCSVTLLISYPFWVESLLGNMEICIWVMVAGGVWAFFNRKKYLAATLFGLAGAVKIFPFVYLGLLVARKQYRPVIYAIMLAVGINLVALWVVYPNVLITLHGIENNLNVFRSLYVVPLHGETWFDHSLFGLVKRASSLRGAPPAMIILSRMASIYLACVACLGFFLYFKFIRYLPMINQVLSICVISILFPPISFDYTLMHLYVPWSVLALLAVRKPRSLRVPALGAAFICFAILMAPETEFIVRSTSFGGQIKALTLVALLAISLRYPFENEELVADTGSHTSMLSTAL